MRINPKDIIKAANEVASSLKNNEKFAIPLLAIRAAKGAEAQPNDQTIRLMSNVLNKMSENGKIFISRAEFKDIYSKFATRNTIACDLFHDELDLPEPMSDEKAHIIEDSKEQITPEEMFSSSNKSILNAISELWDDNGKAKKQGEYKLYDPKAAKQAGILTNLELSRIGFEPKKINTFGGSTNFIICDAVYETPKGEAHLLVPVELTKSGALIPNMFVNNYGFAVLNKTAVNNHIMTTAGKSFEVNSESLLNMLKSGKDISVYDEDELNILAAKNAADLSKSKLTKQASTKLSTNSISFDNNNIFYSEIDKENTPINPKAEGYEKFASKLATSSGMAEISFGKNIVENGRAAVINKMAMVGYRSQVSVASCDEDSITYAVRIDTKAGPLGLEAIAEVKNNKVLIPSIFAIKDRAYDFTNEGISKAIESRASDSKMLAVVSPLYDLKPSEILGVLRKSAEEKDYEKAEEALNVLAENADHETYLKAMTDYMMSLTGEPMSKQASVQCRCNRIVTSSTHSQKLCGHLNMPLDQVYQNENGECIPKYRKNMPDCYEGMLFNTSKIFF